MTLSSPLLDLLTRFPNATVTIRSSRKSPSPAPRAGDRRFIKSRGGWCVRLQEMAHNPDGSVIGGCVRNGKPVWEWVPEEGMISAELAMWKRVRENRGDKES